MQDFAYGWQQPADWLRLISWYVLQVHRNYFVEFVERWRVWAVLRRRGTMYSKLAAEEVSPYLAQLADIEQHEEELLTPAGREVSIVRCILHACYPLYPDFAAESR